MGASICCANPQTKQGLLTLGYTVHYSSSSCYCEETPDTYNRRHSHGRNLIVNVRVGCRYKKAFPMEAPTVTIAAVTIPKNPCEISCEVHKKKKWRNGEKVER